MRSLLITFVLALAIGAAAGWFGHERYGAGFHTIEATVVSERLEEERLVLVLETEDHAILATFRARAADVDELVSVGDTLRIGSTNGVFTDDPQILEVRRAHHGGHGGDDLDGGVPLDGSIDLDGAVPLDGSIDLGGAVLLDGAVVPEAVDGGDAGVPSDAGADPRARRRR